LSTEYGLITLHEILEQANSGTEELDLSNRYIRSFPTEIFNFQDHIDVDNIWYGAKQLRVLNLDNNQLTSLPPEIKSLHVFEELCLNNNQLTSLPPEIGQLTGLRRLSLENNRLISLPPELRFLTNLQRLDLAGNPLISPPPEIVQQGTKAVLAFLSGQFKEKEQQWLSKLLIVGEGGVGKTSLLRVLQGRGFVEGLETTHGIAVEKLELRHPREGDVRMELNTWDFGGQQIYHATHQFFLTNRSLFVLVWDARHGWESGKLYEWMDRIQARAPQSPVLIVAAHVDERDADLPITELACKYSQIVGHYKVSNKKGTGVAKFKSELAEVAAGLPLMGQEWPASWLAAVNEIRSKSKSYISPKQLYKLMKKYKLEETSAKVLAQWMHELGEILYFTEDSELNSMVILDPQWVTEVISKVLESEEVIKKKGVFTHKHMNECWSDIDQNVREYFLRLMERFDLSYRTLENREISLVVERLPLDPPDYKWKWNAIKEEERCKEVSMKFKLSNVPAGIPTWFIARSHRFTTHTHWRNGAVFADSREERHLALIETYPYERYLRLTVRGPAPHNFFVLLRAGLELTLARFPGLEIMRTIPCPGHGGVKCKYEFAFDSLEKAIEREELTLEIQCPESFKYVSVPGLLFGLHWKTQDEIIKCIDNLREEIVAGQEKVITELAELKELMQREFLRLFNREQRLSESHCPNVFVILPEDGKGWAKNIFGQKVVLQLYCQAPGHWHPTTKGGRYEIKQPPKWLKAMAPYVMKLAKVIKYAAPLIGPIAGMLDTAFEQEFKHQLKMMEELAKKLHEEKELVKTGASEDIVGGENPKSAEGAELWVLRKFLEEVDRRHDWGGLQKVFTPEGQYLWLCEYHAKEYMH